MVFAFSLICVQSAINSLGTDIIVGSTAAFNLELFAYYILTGFGTACTTLVGQNFGAGNFDRCQLSFRICMILGLVFYLASGAIRSSLDRSCFPCLKRMERSSILK